MYRLAQSDMEEALNKYPSYYSNNNQTMQNKYNQPSASSTSSLPANQAKMWKAEDYLTKDISLYEVKDVKGAFDVFDVDHSGIVDANELKQAFVSLGLANTNKLVYNLLHQLDGEHPQGLNFEEFLKLATGKLGQMHTRKQIERVFYSFDHERKGKINALQFKRVADLLGEHMSEEDIENVFKKTDYDQDGFVTAEDFYCIMTHKPLWE